MAVNDRTSLLAALTATYVGQNVKATIGSPMHGPIGGEAVTVAELTGTLSIDNPGSAPNVPLKVSIGTGGKLTVKDEGAPNGPPLRLTSSRGHTIQIDLV